MTKSLRFIFTLLICFISLLACKKQGCTNFAASNYDSSAKEDDGSCEFSGCIDPAALNYDPDAEVSDGSCEYRGNVFFYTTRTMEFRHAIEIYWNDQYAGRLINKCEEEIECGETPCDFIDILSLEPGSYKYTCVYGDVSGFTGFTPEDTLANRNLSVGSGRCSTVLID